MADTALTNSRTLEQRLDSLGLAWGGSSDPAAFSPTVAPLLTPTVGPDFLYAVAARRTAVIVKTLVTAGGLVGLAAVLVVLAMRVPPRTEPVVTTPTRQPEPTFWNLRPAVQDPATLDPLTGTFAEPNAATGLGTPAPDATGVSPRQWPADLMPRP